jgi:polysaccharide export outer membrane protein
VNRTLLGRVLVCAATARRRGVALAAAVALAACAAPKGDFIWVDDFAPERGAAPAEYTIAPGDLVSVQVWDNEKLSTRARVRSDGRISMPLLTEVTVAGKAPKQVAADVERALKEQNYVVNPRVNVLVEEMTPLTVSVLGAVARAGTYALAQGGGGVAEALASAGGLTDFAHKDRIFVIRRVPQPIRIRFTFAALTAQTGRAATFRLMPGDVVVAE